MGASSPIRVRRSQRDLPHARPSSPKLTLDLLLLVLSRTLFQPFIACLLPFCLRALATPYSSTSFIATTAYAAAVCIYHLLAIANQRLAYGAPRKINWKDEVVVISGGCRGLGACIAEIYGLRGVSVAVLDTAVPKEEEDGQEKEGVHYYHCDVASRDDVETTMSRISDELGYPTILINNAAISHKWSVQESSSIDADGSSRVLDVDFLSNYHTASSFLHHKGRRQAATIVTVSSVLGYLGAANLSAYSASKAASIAWHHSLTAELAITKPNVRTILVATGQLDTELFSHAKVQGRLQGFLAPVLGAGEVAMRIVEMIDAGRGGEIRMPFYANWISILAVLPAAIQKNLRWWSGIDVAMEGPQLAHENDPGEKIRSSNDSDDEPKNLSSESEGEDSDGSNV